MGVLRDFFRIPSYVRDINDEISHMEYLTQQMQKRPKVGGIYTVSC